MDFSFLAHRFFKENLLHFFPTNALGVYGTMYKVKNRKLILGRGKHGFLRRIWGLECDYSILSKSHFGGNFWNTVDKT